MNSDGSAQTQLTTNSAVDDEPAWSPDGTKIVFTSNRNGNNEIYVMNADGSAQTRLTTNAASDVQPAWSPDGTKIAFQSTRTGADEVFVMNANGTSPTNLTGTTENGNPAWSPDGSKIAFQSLRNGPTEELYVMNANGTGQTRLTTNSVVDGGADWSPDGSKIAFQSQRDGNAEIYTVNPDGTNPTRLTNNAATQSRASWSPDGLKIAYESNQDAGNYEIYSMDANGGNQVRLTTDSGTDETAAWQTIPAAPTYTVGTTGDMNDATPGDGNCNDGSGNCTLRAAIQESNAHAGADTIHFGIGTGAVMITPATQLPAITDPVTIDGTTQPGFGGVPIVRLDGASAIANGLTISAGSSTVRGLIITRFTAAGIDITSNGSDAITGNYIGTNGTTALGNGYGVRSTSTSTNIIGGTGVAARNVISGNGTGVYIDGGSGNQITGNYIGTDVFGAGAVANSIGLLLTNSTTSNTIGGTTAAARNVISGNTGTGVEIQSGAASNSITGNFIGLDAFGHARGNGVDGVEATAGAGANTIGGTAAGQGNSIAYNGSDGVHVDGATPTNGIAIRGNYIYNNGGFGIQNVNGGNGGISVPIIIAVGATVTGTACASCQIDVFSDSAGQGHIYQGSTTADSGGTWSYSGKVAGPYITATATDGSGNTSQFSAPFGLIINGVAGSAGNAGFSGDGGQAQNALLNGPHGIFKTAANVLYFADTGNNRIRTINPDAPGGTIDTVAGCCGLTPGYNGDGIAATAAKLSSPTDVYVAASGDFFIADTNNCRIRKVSGGMISTVAGNGTCGFGGDGGPATAAQINKPHGVALDASGNIIIADTENSRVRSVNTGSGTITTIAGTGASYFGGDGGLATAAVLNHASDVYVKPDGSIVIADTANNRVRVIDGISGVISTVAGTGVAGYNGDGILAVEAQINAPEAISVDDAGNILIADTKNNRIRHVGNTSGLISTVAGMGTQGSSGDGGIATLAQLNNPAGVSWGSVAISDTGNNTIRAIEANVDPTTGESTPPSARPSTFCREGASRPIGALADWSVIFVVVGVIAGRKRVRWLFTLLARQTQRAAGVPG